LSEYDESYYRRARRTGLSAVLGRLAANLDVTLLARKLSSKGAGGRLLEIGFGDGSFLSAMADRGWEARGIDVSRAAADMAGGGAGIKVDQGDILEKPYEEEFFDMVVMRHVLEHMQDPSAVLDEVNRILKPGGLLCVIVPNVESVEANIGGANWFHLDREYHLSHFSPATLAWALQLAGFREIRLDQMLFEFRQTLTYSIMSRVGLEARPGRGETVPLWRKALLYTLLPFGVPLSFAFSLIGRGGTVRATAWK
jgi:2-polyprenyl-3-methyl-5-hydroxy-6-metoxy-1,4-benzoquinol methylase